MQQPPKRRSYNKCQKGRNRGMSSAFTVEFGQFGLRITDRGQVNARQIEAMRRVIVRTMNKKGKLIIRVFPDKPVSKKPLEVRQGKGKGSVELYVFEAKPGTMLFELKGIDKDTARLAFKKASAKLHLKCEFVVSEDYIEDVA
jgi:large subunit ribosomal protein L16